MGAMKGYYQVSDMINVALQATLQYLQPKWVEERPIREGNLGMTECGPGLGRQRCNRNGAEGIDKYV